MNLKVAALLSVVLIAIAAVTTAAFIGTAPADYRGVYVTSKNIRGPQQMPEDGSLVESAASGVFVRIAWNVLQPTKLSYDWSLFDRLIKPAVRSNKKLSIGIIAGSYAPDWLGDQDHIPFATFKTPESNCRVGRIYFPWSGDYQDRYISFMKALKEHLKSIGGYDNLKIIKVSFVAQHTLELRLPARRAGERDNCQFDDANKIWAKAGYKPDLVLAGYRRVVAALSNDVFPGKLLSQATQRGIPFPDVDNNSQIVANGVADAPLYDNLVRSCIELAKGLCAIQNQSLQSVGPLGDRVLGARSTGAIIGWQTAINKGRGRCQLDQTTPIIGQTKHVPRVACTSELYARVLKRATDAGASYLELWREDVRDFSNVVQSADRTMNNK